MRVNVVRAAGDLERQVWVFEFIVDYTMSKPRLTLRYYAPEKRATKRHKFVRDGFKFYEASGDERLMKFSADTVPIPADVVQEAMRLVFEQAVFVLPWDRNETRKVVPVALYKEGA